MTITTRQVEYQCDDCLCEGFLATDGAAVGLRPGVLIAHTWGGCGELERAKAQQLAGLGYVAFALDLYGKGVRGSNADENRRLVQPFMSDRSMLQRRMVLAVDVIREQPEVDGSKVAAIGFCFGGLCVLDLARSGADVRGVASFHGLLTPPGNATGNSVRAKIIVLHGWNDPMATPEHLFALGNELTSLGADWQIHAYGKAMHAFTNPAADNPDFGTLYQPDADRRSWQAMQAFLAEVFASDH